MWQPMPPPLLKLAKATLPKAILQDPGLVKLAKKLGLEKEAKYFQRKCALSESTTFQAKPKKDATTTKSPAQLNAELVAEALKVTNELRQLSTREELLKVSGNSFATETSPRDKSLVNFVFPAQLALVSFMLALLSPRSPCGLEEPRRTVGGPLMCA